jgi:hypothetical protein
MSAYRIAHRGTSARCPDEEKRMAHDGHDRRRQPRRRSYEEILDGILSYRTRSGARPGIFGADRCQLCGMITPFSTFVGAMASHFGRDLDCVCADCIKRHGRTAVATHLRGSKDRRCEACGSGVARARENRLGSSWICRRCRPDMACADPGSRPDAKVLTLVRRRYIELEYPMVQDARQLERRVRAMRAELDRMESNPRAAR